MKLRTISSIIAIVVMGAGVLSCDSGEFKSSEDGYEFKYVREGSGETPQQGEVVWYNMSYKSENDSVLFESSALQPVLFPCDTAQWNMMGALYKAFAKLKVGDSLLIKIPTKQVFSESFNAAVPPSLDPEGKITFSVGVKSYMTEEQAQAEIANLRERQQEEMMAQSEEQMEEDAKIIEEYLSENNIDAQSTEDGLRYVIDVEGSGDTPQPGDKVKVHYTGMLIDGTQFDSSIDRGEPLSFNIGRGEVIRGWDLGIALLKTGGKGTLYIPSPLAYGTRGSAPVIPPNAVLKFDVELIEIN